MRKVEAKVSNSLVEEKTIVFYVEDDITEEEINQFIENELAFTIELSIEEDCIEELDDDYGAMSKDFLKRMVN